MKIITYNIHDGAPTYFQEITTMIRWASPDILLLNEASQKYCDQHERDAVGSRIGLPYHHFAPSTSTQNHSMLFSKYPLEGAVSITGLVNAGMVTGVLTPLGKICIAGIHLAPDTESRRLMEAQKIFDALAVNDKVIIMGDFNAVSADDQAQLALHPPISNQFEFAVLDYFKVKGYQDAAVLAGSDDRVTVPYTIDGVDRYYSLRLDYILVSQALAEKVSSYEVQNRKPISTYSDHLPVVVTLGETN